MSDFIFLGSKITAGGDCSHEIKRCLLLGRKVMTNLDSILKQPRCPSADEWIEKFGRIHTVEYYSAIKTNIFESVLIRQMNL